MLRRLDRRRFVQATAIAPLALTFGAGSLRAKAGASQRPNILYIVADDLGYADLSIFGGHGANTPILDNLAREGVMLPQAYANSSVCSPSRVGIITGRYPGRFRVGLDEPLTPASGEVGLPRGFPTLPALLKRVGYETVLIGKWHLGSPPKFGPLESGYDRFYGIYEGGADYFRNDGHTHGFELGQLYDNADPVDRIGYLTDQLGKRAIAEVKAAVKSSAPFFISLHFTAPHWPWESRADALRAAELDDIVDETGGSVRTYAAMVKSLDENIGRVLDELSAQGLTDNTIVVFVSDNGGERFSDTWPLIGMKGELLEGGIRIPMLLRWPGQLPKGKVCQQVISLFDLYPTLLAAAGTGPDVSFPPDGVNLLDVLAGRAPIMERKLYWRHKRYDQAAIRDGNWKYIRINGNEHLFNIAEDERERAEKKDIHPDIFVRLKADWNAWNAAMLPYPEESYSTQVNGRAERY